MNKEDSGILLWFTSFKMDLPPWGYKWVNGVGRAPYNLSKTSKREVRGSLSVKGTIVIPKMDEFLEKVQRGVISDPKDFVADFCVL